MDPPTDPALPNWNAKRSAHFANSPRYMITSCGSAAKTASDRREEKSSSFFWFRRWFFGVEPKCEKIRHFLEIYYIYIYISLCCSLKTKLKECVYKYHVSYSMCIIHVILEQTNIAFENRGWKTSWDSGSSCWTLGREAGFFPVGTASNHWVKLPGHQPTEKHRNCHTKIPTSHSIHGTIVYLPLFTYRWRVDFYGKLVGI